jgi:trehalose monomycolate/heme transporter
MLAVIARFSIRHRRAILVVAALLLPVMLWVSRGVFPMLRAGGFEDPARESWRVHERFLTEMNLGAADILAIYTSTHGETVDDVEVLSAVLPIAESLKTHPDVVSVLSYYDTGASSFVNQARTASFLLISLRGDDQSRAEAAKRLEPLLAVAADAPVTLEVGGITVVNHALFRTISDDLRRAELLAIPLTGLLMLFFFGSVVATLLPLLVGVLAVAFALTAMRALLLVTDVSLFAANAISIMGLGLAIDYSLFLVARFRDELRVDGNAHEAVVRTLQTTGRAIVFSGITVAAGVCGLLVFPQMLLRSIAWGGLAVVVGSILLVLTVLPALLATLGSRIDAWSLPWADRTRVGSGGQLWERLARAVMKRPVVVVVVIVIGLLALAQPFARFNASLPDHRILPATEPARMAMHRLDTEFVAHQSTSHDLLIELDVPALSNEGLEHLWQLHQTLKTIEGITSIESPMVAADMLGKERAFALLQEGGRGEGNIAGLLRLIVKGNLVRIRLVSAHVFHDPPALAQALALRAIPDTPQMTIHVSGISALLVDLQDTMRARVPWMLLIVFGSMFVVLFFAFGSVLLPIKAILMNTLSITASFGALVYVFQDGRWTSLLQYEALGISDATQPLILFCVVFGLSMDYEVLLLARVREEFDKTGAHEESVVQGLVQTGRLITSAAAVLIVVVTCFLTSRILFMKTLGVGMALAVFVDATIIRILLVPATMQLLGTYNWWAPKPLERLWKRIGMHKH